MKKTYILINVFILGFALTNCSSVMSNPESVNIQRAESIMDSLYKYYSIDGTMLLRENYPFDEDYNASYLASKETKEKKNLYSYLWPYSGSLSAVNAMYESGVRGSKKILETKVLVGLSEYYDSGRMPAAYSSYVNSEPASDRFYDDNVWLGIDFTDLYALTKEKQYIERAEQIWKFIESGIDERLGGGIYWCEQNKASKNTCSNAPGAVFALKLYMATHNNRYLTQGRQLYEWTKKTLQDPSDYLYWDNIALDGKIGEAKYAYNSGQMIQAAALLYKITKDERYLTDAQRIAASGYRCFFHDFTPFDGTSFRILNKGNIWFTAVMLRGYVELYLVDKDRTYMDSFSKNLDWAWENARDEKGLFSEDWSGQVTDTRKWLLTQAAFAEMYARMGKYNK